MIDNNLIKKQKVTTKRRHSVSEPLDEIELSEEQLTTAITEATTGSIGSSIPIFRKVLEWTERVKQNTKEEKLKILLKHYSAHFESIEKANETFNFLLGTRSGQVLFSKIVNLLDSNTDEEAIELLANILKKISDTDFEKQFEQHLYILSQIDKLTPQALIMLSKYEIWKQVSLSGGTTTSKHTVLGDWDSQVANFLARSLKITDSNTVLRIAHSFLELESAGLIFLDGSFIKLAIIGAEIYQIIIKK